MLVIPPNYVRQQGAYTHTSRGTVLLWCLEDYMNPKMSITNDPLTSLLQLLVGGMENMQHDVLGDTLLWPG